MGGKEKAAVIQKQKELEEGFVEESNRKKKNVRSRFKAGALDQPWILTLGVVKRTWWGLTTLRIIHGVHGSSVKRRTLPRSGIHQGSRKGTLRGFIR